MKRFPPSLNRAIQQARTLSGVKEAPKKRRGVLNKTEAAYLAKLEAMKAAGHLLWIGKHEGIALKLADDASYRPDFVVMDHAGLIECHEVKGFWREAARLRIKVAASLYPFRFLSVRRIKGEWEEEQFSGMFDQMGEG